MTCSLQISNEKEEILGRTRAPSQKQHYEEELAGRGREPALCSAQLLRAILWEPGSE